MSAVSQFVKILEGNKNGNGLGIYSICSAQPVVVNLDCYKLKKIIQLFLLNLLLIKLINMAVIRE